MLNNFISIKINFVHLLHKTILVYIYILIRFLIKIIFLFEYLFYFLIYKSIFILDNFTN